jgi:2-amino-4-hydroxy-6-hydroxymethyldihydropteridine diphosphokinase
MKVAYLSLGSNMGDRRGHLREAIAKLTEAGLRVTRVSPVYETEPVDFKDQGWFLNLVVEIETDLFPMQLLSRTQKIEQAMGRRRTVAKGPRLIDIDILLYGRTIVKAATLESPHPLMAERRFVLAPLADLDPELRHPGTHRSVRDMLGSLEGQQARKVDPLEPA